jgi:hypothetical protein
MEISDVSDSVFEWWDVSGERKDPGVEVSRKLAAMMGGHIQIVTNMGQTSLQLQIKSESLPDSPHLKSLLPSLVSSDPPEKTNLVIVLSELGTY